MQHRDTPISPGPVKIVFFDNRKITHKCDCVWVELVVYVQCSCNACESEHFMIYHIQKVYDIFGSCWLLKRENLLITGIPALPFQFYPY